MQIEFLNTEIKNIESRITCEASKNESVKILMSMTGIDYFSAMMIVSEIGDITRFSAPEKLVSWSGLCPSIHQSLHGKDEGLKQEDKMDINSGSKHGSNCN
jgi:transposase